MKFWNNFSALFIKVFEDTRFFRALARFISIVGAIWAVAFFVDRIRSTFTPLVLHLLVSAFALSVCMFALIEIYDKIYGKLSAETRIFRHPFLTYNTALIKAIRLSALDDSYFIAVTWMKFSRVTVSIPIIGSLFLAYEMDNHSHKLVLNLLGQVISVHAVLDAVMVTAMLSLTVFALWQLAEINLIARGTARFVNKRRNAMVRMRNARKSTEDS